MAYEPSSADYADSRTQYSVGEDHFESQRSRARESSDIHGDKAMAPQARPAHQQPVAEIATPAFSTLDTQNYVPPELIAQITESVIKQLKTTTVEGGATPVPQNQHNYPPPPPPPVHQPIPLSPSTVSTSSPPMPTRKVYTPPSPQKHTDHASHGSPPSHSAFFPPQSPRETPVAHFTDRRTSSPLSQTSDLSHTRPKGPMRLSTGKEETTLEKIWGQLFDEESHPTTRLGQFLRGLAVHIIEDYEPCNSLVITPTKMVKYYEDVRLPNEIYPWSTVFDDECSFISRMYRDLACQHHLVQEHFDERPDIPGLTPVGFERWVTLLIQAHPEQEYERLQKAVLAMPISNPDDKKERFPKEISRRLFPGFEDRHVRERIAKAVADHAKVDVMKHSGREDSPTHRPSVSESQYVPATHRREPSVTVESGTSTYLPANIERERKPYSNTPLESAIDDTNPSSYIPNKLERERQPYSNVPSDSAIDDTNPIPASQPIERERKPYSALPGGGKMFEDEARAREAGKPRSDSTQSRAGRSDSSARPRPTQGGANPYRPMEVPKPEIHQHRGSSNVRRHRSPSFSMGGSDFRRSDGDLRTYPPTFHSGPAADGHDDDARRYARDRAHRQADEDSRSYGESPNYRARHDRGMDMSGPPRGSFTNSDEDFYRASGRGQGTGYDYSQPAYGGSTYR